MFTVDGIVYKQPDPDDDEVFVRDLFEFMQDEHDKWMHCPLCSDIPLLIEGQTQRINGITWKLVMS